MKKILLTLFILGGLGVSVYAEQTPQPVTNGRYAIVFSPHIQKSTFLLDTRTGKTWSLSTDENGYYYWDQCQYEWFKQDGSHGGYSRNSIPSK